MTSLDLETQQKGTDGPFERWEGDHTAFVHVLWAARRQGLTLENNADEIVSILLRSRAMAARTAHAIDEQAARQVKAALLREADHEDSEADACMQIADDAHAALAEGGHHPEKADGLRLRAKRFELRAQRFRERAAQLREQAR